jgi:uncharacterized protein YndB with AHSA1/START domain
MSQETTTVVRREITVRAPIERAFAVFTERFGDFKPPDRVVFSWDISPQWQIESEPDNTSEVEVRFIAEAPALTRVVLEHRDIDRHGPGWRAVADGVADDAGWPLYLARYAALFAEGD